MCVCVCEHLWLQSGLVCGCVSWLLCARKVLVSVRVERHGVLEVTPCSGVFVCSPGFYCKMGVVCCGFDVLWVRKSCVSWSVGVCLFCGCKVASCVCVCVGWVLLAVQVWKSGGERCVDLERQKEGKKSTPKR